MRTRFVPPKLRPQVLRRPRVEALLARSLDFPLTMVRAEAGYGKTTAVAALLAVTPVRRAGASSGPERSGTEHLWYNVGDSEVDPELFLRHLIAVLRSAYPTVGTRALARLASEEDRARLSGPRVKRVLIPPERRAKTTPAYRALTWLCSTVKHPVIAF